MTSGAKSAASVGSAINSSNRDAASTMAVVFCQAQTPRVSRGLGTPCGKMVHGSGARV